MLYTYSFIKSQYEKGMSELESRKSDPINKKELWVYGHALDIIDLSRELHHYLNLKSNENLPEVITTLYIEDRKKGCSITECQDDLIKKMGAYEFLRHCNFFQNETDIKTEFQWRNNFVPILSLMNPKTKKVKTLDVFSCVEAMVKRDFVYISRRESLAINATKEDMAFVELILQNTDKLIDKSDNGVMTVNTKSLTEKPEPPSEFMTAKFGRLTSEVKKILCALFD